MELNRLSKRIFYYAHQSETDRPMLAYLAGDRTTLVIDAGNSAAHVEEFYAVLKKNGLNQPDLTAITHWHWDHTFGLHRIHGLSIAHTNTNKYLRQEAEKLKNGSYSDFLRENDFHLGREYAHGKKIVAVPADIEFADELILHLGGITARMFHAVSPHSEDTILIDVPEEKVLFLGDATSEDFYREGYLDKQKLRALMDIIARTDCQHCVLSHTEPLSKTELIAYLETLL